MNLNLYRCDGKWLAVDCGIGFGGAAHPEVEVMMPDPASSPSGATGWSGLVITHAHEDHIGAVRLAVAAAALPGLRHAVRRRGAAAQAGEVAAAQPGEAARRPARRQRSTCRRSRCSFIRVAHSIPEAQALVIRHAARHCCCTPATGSSIPSRWSARRPTRRRWRRSASEGVLAMVCDSTNAMVEGHSGCEAEVRAEPDAR